MKWNKYILIIFLMIILTNPVSSLVQSLPIQKTNTCVNLPQFCSSCSFVTLSSVQLPNSTILNYNINMTKNGAIYNFTFCLSDLTGQYIVNTIPDGNITAPYDFIVNPLGKIFTNSQAILYFLIFFISLILFLICLYSGFSMPYSNKKDQMTGYIFAIENLKYFKVFLLAVSYIMLTLMVYFGWIISYGYLDLDFLGKLFNLGFYALLFLMLPLFIIGVFIIIANVIRDSKVNDMLSRGFKIR